ncbi:MAG TPA: ABC transporter ATP-binding protein [Roseiflexaceae bacterium]|nr:ABC transporter ATP-binding protein [Roseiflexaceae bacterium]
MTQTSPQPLVIDSRHVDMIFGKDAGVFDQTYTLPEGTIFGMIGPSGCGKTTTVRLALGLLTPHRGSLSVMSRAPTSFRASDRERIGYIPQQFVLYPNLTVTENAQFVASLYGLRTARFKQRLEELLEFVDLSDARDRLGKQLSGGMQRRLMLAGALMHEPALLFADEPTAGIDPVLRWRFWEYFRRLREQGRTLFVTTQYVGEAAYCDYVAVMRKGRLLVVDTPQGLRRRVLGGDIIQLKLADHGRMAAALAALKRFEPVQSVARVPGSDDLLHVTVDDAGEWMPEVLNQLETNSTPPIVVESAEEYLLSYDDIFIKIMEQEEAAHA